MRFLGFWGERSMEHVIYRLPFHYKRGRRGNVEGFMFFRGEECVSLERRGKRKLILLGFRVW